MTTLRSTAAASLAALAVLALTDPATAQAADGVQVLDCIKKVSRESWAGSQAREAIAAVACRGIGDSGVGGKEFEQKVKVLRECFDKVSFRSKAKGTEAEAIAATACVGATNAEETAACVDKVSFHLDASGSLADRLAAIACGK